LKGKKNNPQSVRPYQLARIGTTEMDEHEPPSASMNAQLVSLVI
jgi:hypothetical protein